MSARRATVTIVALCTLAVACGQYPHVHERAVGVAGGDGSLSGMAGTTEEGFGTAGPALEPAERAGTTGRDRRGAGGTSGRGTGSGAPGPGEQPVNAPGHTTVGVTTTTITIGLHAPITGAAPVTDESFDLGKDLYWRYGNGGRPFKIFGRTVEVIVEDDRYNPSYAQSVCQEMVQQRKAFMLIGGAGTDQIVQCARFAATQPGPVPYLSAGVAQQVLQQYPNYFALSMSYPQQVPLLVQYIRRELGITRPSRVAIVATNTANFDDAVAAWNRAFPGTDLYRPNKNDPASTTGQQLCNGPLPKYDVVFPLVAPLFFLEMANAANCKPQFAGVGITMGIDAVANATCLLGYETGDTHFFSPAPAFSDVGRRHAQFRRAAETKFGSVDEADDIMWILFGTMGGLHQLFARTGADLSRERFIAAAQDAALDGQGIFPDIRYTPSNRFGASSVSVLELVCEGRGGHYRTEHRNVSGF